jgi:hypothetical protein
MAERTHIPNSPDCGQWEMLLADALDGLLRPEDEAVFTAHKAVCPACAALFEEARRGREWLEFLSPEPEVPAGLLGKILAQTGPGQVAGYGLVPEGSPAPLPVPQSFVPAWQRPGFLGHLLRFAEPRLMMTAAMAFFSIALTLNLAGIRLTQLRMADLHLADLRLADLRLADLRLSSLRPTAVRSYMERQLTTASIPIIRYYDHLHVFYELQSGMRELRGATQYEGQGEEYPQRYEKRPATPGESMRSPGRNLKHIPERNSPLKPDSGSSNDEMEASLTFQKHPAHSGSALPQPSSAVAQDAGSAMEVWERNTVWTA